MSRWTRPAPEPLPSSCPDCGTPIVRTPPRPGLRPPLLREPGTDSLTVKAKRYFCPDCFARRDARTAPCAGCQALIPDPGRFAPVVPTPAVSAGVDLHPRRADLCGECGRKKEEEQQRVEARLRELFPRPEPKVKCPACGGPAECREVVVRHGPHWYGKYTPGSYDVTVCLGCGASVERCDCKERQLRRLVLLAVLGAVLIGLLGLAVVLIP